ncbi:MAG TPA: hypothetical protein VIW29_14660 [Polyangiaceae bacterium]
MNPDNGGKIELKLTNSSAESATYAATLQTPQAIFETAVQVGPAAGPGQVGFGAWRAQPAAEPPTGAQEAPPSWLLADARAALKAALRTSQSEGRWPRRITRWRSEPAE